MTTYSQVFSGPGGKSNARRAARNQGIDPNSVRSHGDGWRFPLDRFDEVKEPKQSKAKAKPAATKKAKADTPRQLAMSSPYKSHFDANEAAFAQARRSGLPSTAFTIVIHDGRYHFVAAHDAHRYTISTPENRKQLDTAKAAAPKTRTKADKAAAKVARGKAGKPESANGAKMQTLYNMLLWPTGATMAEIRKATGWLAHTARARISGIAKAKGLTVERTGVNDAARYIGRPQGDLFKGEAA